MNTETFPNPFNPTLVVHSDTYRHADTRVGFAALGVGDGGWEIHEVRDTGVARRFHCLAVSLRRETALAHAAALADMAARYTATVPLGVAA